MPFLHFFPQIRLTSSFSYLMLLILYTDHTKYIKQHRKSCYHSPVDYILFLTHLFSVTCQDKTDGIVSMLGRSVFVGTSKCVLCFNHSIQRRRFNCLGQELANSSQTQKFYAQSNFMQWCSEHLRGHVGFESKRK